MDISILDQVRKARNEVMSSAAGNTGTVALPVAHVDALLNALAEAERGVNVLSDSIESLRLSVDNAVDALTYTDFSQETPASEDDGDLFEVFVGPNLTEGGRIFACWDASDESFYRFTVSEAGVEICDYLDDVLFWRACLPEPNEVLNIEGLE